MVSFVKLSELRKLSQYFSAQNTNVPSAQHQELLRSLGISPGSFYQELEMDSRYVDTHQDISYSNTHLQIHSHTFYEMLCCRNTCGAEYLVGSERYKLQKGDIIFIPRGVSHRPLLPETMKEPYIRDVLWISEEFLQVITQMTPELDHSLLSKPFLFRTAGTDWEFLCELFHTGVQEAQTANLGWNTIVASIASGIFIQMIRAGLDLTSKPLAAEKPDLLDRLLAYIESHLSEKITLSDTARHFFISESTISQTFRKKMDISFYQCVTQKRLISSKTLIEQNIALEEVCERVGFNDYSSFYRAFKQEYGISPRQYRKMQNS